MGKEDYGSGLNQHNNLGFKIISHCFFITTVFEMYVSLHWPYMGERCFRIQNFLDFRLVIKYTYHIVHSWKPSCKFAVAPWNQTHLYFSKESYSNYTKRDKLIINILTSDQVRCYDQVHFTKTLAFRVLYIAKLWVRD